MREIKIFVSIMLIGLFGLVIILDNRLDDLEKESKVIHTVRLSNQEQIENLQHSLWELQEVVDVQTNSMLVLVDVCIDDGKCEATEPKEDGDE